MMEDKYRRLFATHWGRAFLIIALLSILIASVLCWMESARWF